MIHIFRKEIRKWYAVLWVILLSLGLSSLAIIFQGGSRFERSKIAIVNGDPITFKEFKYSLAETQQRLDSVRRYARMLGISEDVLLQNYYQNANPHEIALKTAIREKLIDQAKKPLNINIANEDFMEILVNSMPDGLLDERGRLNMSAYSEFLHRMGVTSDEFESRKEAEIARQMLEQFVLNSFYVPRYSKTGALADQGKKSFTVAHFPYSYYLGEVKKEAVADEELKKFYEQHKDSYRVSEKKKARYWRLNPTSYAKKIVLEDDAINAYYQKNKSSQYRIPPKVRLRRILLQDADQANKLHQELKAQPELFAQKARELSQDKDAASNGGLTDIFARGTLEKPVEDAAFRLTKVGEIADVVKTARGYELLQLEERVSAGEKPLEEVRDQIVKSLTAKRALESLKSDLEILLHDAKENADAIKDFVASHDLKAEESAWLDKDAVKNHELAGRLAERLFATSKRLVERGYFFDGESYVIYQLADTQKAHTRPLEQVAKEVEERYLAAKAQEALVKAVNASKAKIAQSKEGLEVAANQSGVQLINTDMIGSEDSVKEIKDFKQISPRAFQLTDKMLVLQQKVGSDYYLVQLKEQELPESKTDNNEIQSEIKEEISHQAHNHVNSFIASLERNAKIERFDAKPSSQVEIQN